MTHDRGLAHLTPLSREEEAYLLFFATGDLNVQIHGRKIRTIVGTTHPAMLEHVLNTLGPYGRSMAYPVTTPGGYGWRLACDLPAEFEFLRRKAVLAPKTDGSLSAEFTEGLSGFGDAEGHIGLSGSGRLARGRFKVSNRVKQIVESFGDGLVSGGFRGRIYELVCNGASQYELEVAGQDAVELLPLLRFRHPEKIAAKRLVLKYHGTPWEVAGDQYRQFRKRIKRQRDEFVKLAETAFHVWPMRKEQMRVELKRRVRETCVLRTSGLMISQISEKLGCSERTVYRHLAADWSRIS